MRASSRLLRTLAPAMVTLPAKSAPQTTCDCTLADEKSVAWRMTNNCL